VAEALYPLGSGDPSRTEPGEPKPETIVAWASRELTEEQRAKLQETYEVAYDRARREGVSMHEAAHRAVRARALLRLEMLGRSTELCGAVHPDTGERCVFTVHAGAATGEYHSWVLPLRS
jgi:hypothetical protein